MPQRARPRSTADRLLTVDDVADMLAFSRKTIYRAIAAGHLRSSKPRGRYRITAEAVDAWIAASEDVPGAVSPVRPPTPVAPRRGTLEALRAIERKATA